MNSLWQKVVVLAVVAGALVYVARRVWRLITLKKPAGRRVCSVGVALAACQCSYRLGDSCLADNSTGETPVPPNAVQTDPANPQGEPRRCGACDP